MEGEFLSEVVKKFQVKKGMGDFVGGKKKADSVRNQNIR